MSKYSAWHHILLFLLLIPLLTTQAFAQLHLLPRFPDGAVWHQDISIAVAHPDSALMISTLDGLGGFGLGRMQAYFAMQ